MTPTLADAGILLAVASAAVIIARAAAVLSRMNWRGHDAGHGHFLGFGLSQLGLAAGAFAAVLSLGGWPEHEGPLVVLLAAGALRILFDRRARRREDRHGITVETLHHPTEEHF